jgi:mono/diheme cytochrome c family protein
LARAGGTGGAAVGLRRWGWWWRWWWGHGGWRHGRWGATAACRRHGAGWRHGRPPAAGGGGGGGSDAKLIATGNEIFHGKVGGATCYVCHGQDAKGTAVGPNLTDKEWLHSDGSLAGITKTIQTGVPQPKVAPAPMPPMGGATLSPDQVKAVAAYEHSLGGGK